ncbi:MAG: universal stress protein [Anaerolineae bacterium]|nr:universal stress protein [Anaerolineae bacterium]
MMEFKHILVPLDGSSLSERALPVACVLARKFESQIILLRVLDIPTPTAPTSHLEETIGWIREARRHALQEAQSYLEAIQRELYGEGFETRILLRDRSPAEDILDVACAEHIDLIVMSSQGKGGWARWTLGGVAEKVARHSLCPVLLVRQEPEAASES